MKHGKRISLIILCFMVAVTMVPFTGMGVAFAGETAGAGLLVAEGQAKAGRNILKWTDVDRADGYEIYFAKCGDTLKKVKTIKESSTHSFVKKGLNDRKCYKYAVKAYEISDGGKNYLQKSPTIHVAGIKVKYSNGVKVALEVEHQEMNPGGTSMASAQIVKRSKSSRLLGVNHAAAIRYYSSDRSVATVTVETDTSTATVTAAGEGSCWIYAVSPNGAFAKAMVNVKSVIEEPEDPDEPDEPDTPVTPIKPVKPVTPIDPPGNEPDPGSEQQPEHHYVLQDDGSWVCTCSEEKHVLEGTDKPYATVISKGQPTEIMPLTESCDIGQGHISVDGNKVTYENSSRKLQDVAIRTDRFSTKLYVNDLSETKYSKRARSKVRHFGYSGFVKVQGKSRNTFVEKGVIGRLQVEEGNCDIKGHSIVYQVLEQSGDSSYITVGAEATVYRKDGTKVEGAVDSSSTGENHDMFTDEENVTGEKVCRHEAETGIVADGNHVYEVCRKCGYTLISIRNLKAREETKKDVQDASDENVIIPMATYGDSQIDDESGIELEDTGAVILKEDSSTDTGYVTPSVKPTPVLKEGLEIDSKCTHESLSYSDEENDSKIHIVECDNCGLTWQEGHDWGIIDHECAKCGYHSEEHMWSETTHTCECCKDSVAYALVAGDPTPRDSLQYETKLASETEPGEAVLYYSTGGDTISFWKGDNNTVMPKRFSGYYSLNLISWIANYTFYDINGNRYTYAETPNVVIQEGITEMEKDAFKFQSNIESVTFPSTMKKMGECAFYSCTSLKEIKLNDGLEEIGWSDFLNCKKLTKIDIPDTVTTVNPDAFEGCISLKDVKLSAKQTSIPDRCFGGIDKDKTIGCPIIEIEIPASVKYIGKYSFSNCKELYSIKYKGTKEQWNQIEKYSESGYSWDVKTNGYIIHCADGDITTSIDECVFEVPCNGRSYFYIYILGDACNNVVNGKVVKLTKDTDQGIYISSLRSDGKLYDFILDTNGYKYTGKVNLENSKYDMKTEVLDANRTRYYQVEK